MPSGVAPTPSVTFGYDAAGVDYSIGRLTSVVSTVATISISEYHPRGMPKQSSQTVDGVVRSLSYSYNLADALLSQVYPSGRTVSIDFDGAGRVVGLTSTKSGESTRNYADSISYTSHGAPAQIRLGNNLYERAVFNSRLQPKTIRLGTELSPESTLGLTLEYQTTDTSTDNNGNLLRQKIRVPGLSELTQSYAYDPLNRLSGASETQNSSLQWWQNFDYDQYGNQWVTSHNLPSSVVTLLTPTSVDWFKTAQNVTTNRILFNGYDAAGNQTTAGGGNFAYDVENRQTSALIVGMPGVSFTYAYDGDGRRVKKTITDDGARRYLYAANGQMAAEYKNGFLHKEFIYLGGKLLAVEEGTPAVTSYLTTDHLGSTRVVTDAAGVVKSRHDYLPFGKEVPDDLGGRSAIAAYSTDEHVLQRFTGKEVDPETGLQYFGARYYSGRQSRFTTPDWSIEPEPIPYADLDNPQTLNLYSYVVNNPLLRVDPDGHCCWAQYVDPSASVQVLIGMGRQMLRNFVGAGDRAGIHAALKPTNALQQAGADFLTNKVGPGLSMAVLLITKNNAKGKAFEAQVAGETARTDTSVVRELTLKTESGVRTRMDVVSTNPTREIVLQEAKSSATAPLTPKQTAAHPEIAQTGATVVGKGKPGYPGGTQIPPTQVKVVRPNPEEPK